MAEHFAEDEGVAGSSPALSTVTLTRRRIWCIVFVMKRIAVLQPFYLPWLGVFNQIALSDVFIFGDSFQYSKNSWINRNRIKNPNGGFTWLTVPVKNEHLTSKKISEVEIDYSHDWVKKHLSSIKNVYGKSQYFNDYYPDLERILLSKPKFLFELNMLLFKYLLKILSITTKLKFRSDYKNLSKEKSQSLLEICQEENTSVYLTGPRAQDYLRMDIFKDNKIEVEYQNYSYPSYQQKGDDYVDKLSVIDAIFMLGAQKTRSLIIDCQKTNAVEQYQTLSYQNE